MKTLCVIPVFNEEQNLENTIKINEKFIESTLINVSRSIIFADDVSISAKEFLEKMRGYIER